MTSKPIIIASHVRIEAAASGKRRFNVDAYGGGALRVNGYSLPIVADLAGMTADENIVANLDHDPAKRVGHVDAVENSGRDLKLSGPVSAVSAAASEFVESAINGFRWAASIEAQPDSMEEIPRGGTAQANGQTFNGPALIARKSTLYGIAFLSKGADPTAKAMLATRRNKSMSDFTNWARSMRNDFDSLDHEDLAVLHANYHGRTDVTADDREAVAHFPTIHASTGDVILDAEQQRLRKIDKCVALVRQDDHVRDLKASAVRGELSYDELRDNIINIKHEQAGVPSAASVQQVRGIRGGDNKVIEAALCLAGGLSQPEKHFDDRTLDAADRATRGLGLQSILMSAACGNGYRARPGEYLTDGNLRSVLAAAFNPIHASGFSALDISNVLSSTANKMLQDGFFEMPSEWRSIAAVEPVREFQVAYLRAAARFAGVRPSRTCWRD